MATLQAGASTLYYELHEPDHPVPGQATLVLLHGVGGNHASWFHQLTAWRGRHRLLLVDARGFGNAHDAEGTGWDGFVDDLDLVLQAARVERAVLVGQSMGGGTALAFACRHPGRVAALVLADTLFGIALPEGVRERMAALTARNAQLTQIQRVLGPTCVREQPAMVTLYTALASFNQFNVRTLPGRQPQIPLAAIAGSGVPVLFVLGEEDVLFPPEEVHAVHQALSGSGYVCLPRCGHSAYFEAPAAFNAAVTGWLQERGVAC